MRVRNVHVVNAGGHNVDQHLIGTGIAVGNSHSGATGLGRRPFSRTMAFIEIRPLI